MATFFSADRQELRNDTRMLLSEDPQIPLDPNEITGLGRIHLQGGTDLYVKANRTES